MRKLDLVLFLTLSIFYIMIFKADIFVRSRGSDEKLTVENTFKSAHVVSLNKLSITVIYDNNPYTEGLRAEWGLSCLIRGSERTILFDTGGNGSFLLENMNELGIDPQKIDTVVLSHLHSDHVGGLKEFLDKNEIFGHIYKYGKIFGIQIYKRRSIARLRMQTNSIKICSGKLKNVGEC